MDVFARFGYRRASMDQVAEAAGLTRQAVYHHFKSKEALFRATVEVLHEGAFAEAVAAGRAAEQAGASLADVIASQLEAKFRYVIECLKETSQAEELLSERQHQARDLNQVFSEQNVALQVATIERICKAQRLTLRHRMTPLELARSIHFAIRGLGDLSLNIAAVGELTRAVRLMVDGAIAPDLRHQRGGRASRSSRKPTRKAPARKPKSSQSQRRPR
jgi:AcrR family transcriptional regulator